MRTGHSKSNKTYTLKEEKLQKLKTEVRGNLKSIHGLKVQKRSRKSRAKKDTKKSRKERLAYPVSNRSPEQRTKKMERNHSQIVSRKPTLKNMGAQQHR